jgi:histidine phosphotransferase ChpT
MSYVNADLAALLGSRLCHDLISPIGAIQNGLELLALSGMTKDSPEMSLIQDSCDSATARIRFFRVAFGHASDGQMMSRRETVSTIEGFARGGRMSPEWMAEGDLPRKEVQLAYLAYLCCESALPLGGTVRFERDAAGWSLGVTGRRINVERELWEHLNGAAPLERPAADRVHFALLPLVAQDAGRSILAKAGETEITIKIA